MIATFPFSFAAGVVLGAFFYGYIVAQLPGGLLALKFGGKNLFGTGILCGSVITLLIPLVARIHVGFLIALQFGIGLFQVKLWVSFIISKYEVLKRLHTKYKMALLHKKNLNLRIFTIFSRDLFSFVFCFCISNHVTIHLRIVSL